MKLATIDTGVNITGGIRLGGNNAANEMDDYEEGTWTFEVASGLSSITYGTRAGYYIKIGNMVMVTCEMITVSCNETSDWLKYGTLPFTASNRNISQGAMYKTKQSGNIDANATYQIEANGTKFFVINGAGDAVNGNNTSFGDQNNRLVSFTGVYTTV